MPFLCALAIIFGMVYLQYDFKFSFHFKKACFSNFMFVTDKKLYCSDLFHFRFFSVKFENKFLVYIFLLHVGYCIIVFQLGIQTFVPVSLFDLTGVILEISCRNFVFVANFHTVDKSPNFKN